MRNRLTKICGGLLAAALVYAAGGCGSSSSNAADMGPDAIIVVGTADLGAVTFTQIQEQIFTAQCGADASMGGRNCHLKSPPEGNMLLTIGNAYANIVNVPSTIDPQMNRITPGQPSNSFMWHKLTDNLTSLQGNPMPFQTGGKALPLVPDLLEMMEVWINEGAPNSP